MHLGGFYTPTLLRKNRASYLSFVFHISTQVFTFIVYTFPCIGAVVSLTRFLHLCIFFLPLYT